MSENETRVITSMLLGLLVLVFTVGMIMMYFVIRWRQRHLTLYEAPIVPEDMRLAGLAAWSVRNSQFIRPQTWMAIRSTDLNAVQAAFGLDDARPCPWTDGLTTEASHRFYLSPPIAGWILVLGADLPDPADDIDACYRFLTGLSRRLGHLQYFHSNRVLHHHAWARVESGHVLRAYAWTGHVVWNQGHATSAERELALKSFNYGDTHPSGPFAAPEAVCNNVERLPRLAARWSVDPAAVDAHFWAAHPGISGQASVPRML